MANGTLHSAYLFGKELRDEVDDGVLNIEGYFPKKGAESYVKLCGVAGGPHSVLGLIVHITRSAFRKKTEDALATLLIKSNPRLLYRDEIERSIQHLPDTQLYICGLLRPSQRKGGTKVASHPHHIVGRSGGGADVQDNLIQLPDHIHRPYHSLVFTAYPHICMLTLLSHVRAAMNDKCVRLLSEILLEHEFPKMYKERVLRE